MKILGMIDHRIRNFKFANNTGLKRIDVISRKIQLRKEKFEDKIAFAY